MGERREAAIEPKTQCLQLWLPPQLALCAGVVVLIFFEILRVLQYTPGWPDTHFLAQADLELMSIYLSQPAEY